MRVVLLQGGAVALELGGVAFDLGVAPLQVCTNVVALLQPELDCRLVAVGR